jgi:hypothetical protein
MPMVEARPRCPQHNLALQLIRVEISRDEEKQQAKDEDKIVIDVYGCPSPGCTTEHHSRQGRRTVESGK